MSPDNCRNKLGLSTKQIRCSKAPGHSGSHSAIVNGIEFKWRPAPIGQDVEVEWSD